MLPDEDQNNLQKLSGFHNSYFSSGFRCAVLDDYSETKLEGRTHGFNIAVSATKTERASSETFSTTGNEKLIRGCDKLSTHIISVNPTWALSEWLGVLLAFQSLSKSTDENAEKELNRLINKIENVIQVANIPRKEIIEKFCNNSKTDEKCIDYSDIIEECKIFCNTYNWKIPLHLK